ncbi:hypothetical protein FNT36_11145 [Hymenobacter setariae]|uniref:Uncharacterized protein n=1 Tax=Hymenobacter setariae TaxID=2594794 RepID=A0A558BU56_9BACT|nr:hypothetical protein [Hymenobacter setariae]TVT40054.1 hypothetical protein FNT36_11145 [Hymenobacter setariae]
MTETLAIRNADCLLTVTATQQAPGQLDLRYQVHNHGQLPLYLCNQLYELPASNPDSIPQLLPDLVHIQVEPEGVHLDKALMDLSFREGIRVLDIPYLTQVLPDHSYEQALRLALPLRPYRVHGNQPSQAPPALLPLRFSLGYFKGQQGITAYEVADGPPTDTYQVAPSRNKEQQLLTVGPFKEVVPVADTLLNTTPAQAASAEQWTPWG